MQWTARRIFSVVMLAGTAVTVYQVLGTPQPVADTQPAEITHANAQSFDQKLEQLEVPRRAGSAPAEVHFSSDEVSAGMGESLGGPASVPQGAVKPVSSAPQSPNAVLGQGEVEVKGYQIKLEGNVARGQFITRLGGKDVYVTLAGHLGSQDGYVTFDPTEFKVGDLSIPVSLVNSALQKKLAEQRDSLKLPEGIGSLQIENGELVVTQK
jgi:hypothetical protein